jgi:hypothetical protein
MPSIAANLLEVFQLGSEFAGMLDLPVKFWPTPGQYLPCQRVESRDEHLPTHLFRVLGAPKTLSLGPLPETWGPGDPLLCLPPQGHGFDVPGSARRIGLIPYQVSADRLLSLMSIAFAQNASVALFYESTPPLDLLDWIPSQVEILPLTALAENPDWPEFLALDLAREMIAELGERFSPFSLRCEGQVLVRTDMPCRGLGDCGVCAVHTRRGWRHACVDGPVFPLEEVLHVAG